MLLLVLALGSPALTQNVLTVDSSGNVTATSVITGSVVVAGTYSSGITTVGAPPNTCLITFTNGGGTGATATVELTGTNTIDANSPLAPRLPYLDCQGTSFLEREATQLLEKAAGRPGRPPQAEGLPH